MSDDIDFQVSELDGVLIERIIEQNPEYYVLTEKNAEGKLTWDLTPYFWEKCEVAKKSPKGQDHLKVEIAAYGGDPSGGGKSYIGGTFAQRLSDNEYTAEEIYFSQEDAVIDVKNIIKHANKGKNIVVWVDEISMDFGLGSQMRKSKWLGMLEKLRKKRVSFVLCSNTFKYPTLQHFLVETLPSQISYSSNVTRCILKSNTHLVMGVMLIDSPETTISKKFIDEYENRKDEYLDEWSGEGEGSRISKWAKECMETKEYQMLSNKYIFSRSGDAKDIPYRMLSQLVDDKFPHFKQSITTKAVADKIAYYRIIED